MSETFGERVRRHRKAIGLAQNTLAMRLNISPVAVWHWEHDTRLPRPHMMKALARAFGVSPTYLETGEPDRWETLARAIRADAPRQTLLAMLEQQERGR